MVFPQLTGQRPREENWNITPPSSTSTELTAAARLWELRLPKEKGHSQICRLEIDTIASSF